MRLPRTVDEAVARFRAKRSVVSDILIIESWSCGGTLRLTGKSSCFHKAVVPVESGDCSQHAWEIFSE